jgi:hypothetical protein
MRQQLFALVFAASTALALNASAQTGDLSPRERDDLSRAHFRAGSRYFELRRFAEAAAEFERVFELSGQAALLYNAGRAWEAAGRPREALAAYERFAQSHTEGVDPAIVQESITALRTRVQQEDQAHAAANPQATSCTEPTASAAVTATNTSASAATSASAGTSATATATAAGAGPLLSLQTRVRYEHNTPNMVGPWLCLGVGGVLGAMAVWQGLSSIADSARVRSATEWSPQLTSSYFAARDEGTTALVLTGIGSAAIVGGVVWLVGRGRGEAHEELVRTASVAIVPHGNGGASVVIGGAL